MDGHQPQTERINWGEVAFVKPDPLPKVRDIIAASALHFGLSEEDLKSPYRNREFARARQVVMFLAREMTAASYPIISRELGGRDHTTSMWGVRTIAKLILENREGMPKHVEAVRALVKTGNPKQAVRERDQAAIYAADEAQALQEAEAAIKHAEAMKRLKRIKQLAEAGFIAAPNGTVLS